MNDMPGGDPSFNESEKSEDIEGLDSSDSLEKIAHSIDHIKESTEQTAKEALESKRNFLKSLKIDAYAIPIITVLGVSLSIGASTYWNSKQQHVAHLYNQASELKEDIHRLFTTRDQLLTAMMNSRAIRDYGQKHCKDGMYDGPDKIAFQEKLYWADYDLVKAAYITTGIFNDDVDKAISDFTNLVDIDKQSICGKNAPTDKDLRPVSGKTNTLILTEIKKLSDERDDILKQIKG